MLIIDTASLLLGIIFGLLIVYTVKNIDWRHLNKYFGE